MSEFLSFQKLINFGGFHCLTYKTYLNAIIFIPRMSFNMKQILANNRAVAKVLFKLHTLR